MKEAFAASLKKPAPTVTTAAEKTNEQEQHETNGQEKPSMSEQPATGSSETKEDQWKTKNGNKKNKKTKKKPATPEAVTTQDQPAATRKEEQQIKTMDPDEVIDEEASANAADVTKPPKPSQAQPNLISNDGQKWSKLLQKFRTKMASDREAEAETAKDFNPYTNECMEGEDQLSVTDVLEAHGLVEAATPATGNCQYYALAEAALQISFAEASDKSKLVRTTEDLKVAIRAAALVHFALDFPPIERKDLLMRLRRYE
ncbi:hypothetical protein FI667_g16393, partial [Globisporangium splendens]